MADFDSFQRGGQSQPHSGSGQMGNRASTGGDQFVRGSTAPLATRRTTRPLIQSAEELEKHLATSEQQIQICQTIVEKFKARVRLLQFAEERAKELLSGPLRGAVPPASLPLAPEKPPEKPQTKSLSLKKPAPPAKAQATKSPAGKPAAPGPALNPTELAVAEQISRVLCRSAQARRRAQVALFQFQEALQAVRDAQDVLLQIRKLATEGAAEEAMNRLDLLDTTRIQGKIYPVCNFHEAFRDHPEIARLFPSPNRGSGLQMKG